MFLGKLLRNPDDGYGIESGSICQKLTEVSVIRALNLILDEYPMTGAGILTKDVGAKRSDFLLLRFYFQIDADCFTEKREIIFFRKPRREIASFSGEHIPYVDFR